MDWLIKHKLIAAVVILVATALAWYMLSGSSEPADTVLVSETVQQMPPEAQDLLNSLRALKAVTLQSPVFSNPTFHSLQDFSTPIIPEPIGRSNPFTPFNPNVSVQTTSSSSQ